MKVIDDEEYEKNKNFFLELAEPRMVDMSLQKGAVLNLFFFPLITFYVSRSHTLSLSFLSLSSGSPQASLSLLCLLPLPELSLFCICSMALAPIHLLPPSTFPPLRTQGLSIS